MTRKKSKRIPCCLLLLCVFSLTLSFADADQEAIGEASALIRAGKFPEAEAVLRSAVASDPHSGAIHAALGTLFVKQQRYEDSVRELTIAANLNPESREYVMLLAEALLGWQHFGPAIDLLNAVQSRFGGDFQVHYDLGLAYYFTSKIDEAKSEFEKTLRLAPHFERAKLLLAGCWISKGDRPRAVVLLRELVAEHPKNAIYLSTLGRALGDMGAENSSEAVRICRRALALNPNEPRVQFDAATVFVETEHFAEARPLLENLEKLNPNIEAVHVQLARVYSRLGLRELARKENTIANRLQSQAEDIELPSAEAGGGSKRTQ